MIACIPFLWMRLYCSEKMSKAVALEAARQRATRKAIKDAGFWLNRNMIHLPEVSRNTVFLTLTLQRQGSPEEAVEAVETQRPSL